MGTEWRCTHARSAGRAANRRVAACCIDPITSCVASSVHWPRNFQLQQRMNRAPAATWSTAASTVAGSAARPPRRLTSCATSAGIAIGCCSDAVVVEARRARAPCSRLPLRCSPWRNMAASDRLLKVKMQKPYQGKCHERGEGLPWAQAVPPWPAFVRHAAETALWHVSGALCSYTTVLAAPQAAPAPAAAPGHPPALLASLQRTSLRQ